MPEKQLQTEKERRANTAHDTAFREFNQLLMNAERLSLRSERRHTAVLFAAFAALLAILAASALILDAYGVGANFSLLSKSAFFVLTGVGFGSLLFATRQPLVNFVISLIPRYHQDEQSLNSALHLVQELYGFTVGDMTALQQAEVRSRMACLRIGSAVEKHQ
jgi:hypothetical protein